MHNGIDVIEVEQLNESSQSASNTRAIGRPADTFWSTFTEVEQPWTLKAAVCLHCKYQVSYHKKKAQAMTHLQKKCPPFKTKMMAMEVNDRPSWFQSVKRSRRFEADAQSRPIVIKSAPSTAGSSGQQSSIRQFALPKMTKQEKKNLEKNLALHYYITGSSFQRIEQPHLKLAFQCCRPDMELPDRKKLAGSLLEDTYREMKSRIDHHLSAGASEICLTSDAWTNTSNDPVVNYMAVSSETSLFLESVCTGEQGHTADWISNDLKRVMSKLPAVSGAITDNTTTNKKAWRILQGEFPGKFFHGCVSHGLHLLVKDILAPTKTKKDGSNEATYPVGYPFEHMLLFVEECQEIVKFFHNHHVVKAKLNHLQQQSNTKVLVSPAPTRWGSIQGCLQSILENEPHLHVMVSARDFVSGNAKQREKRQSIKNTITASELVINLEKALEILAPIDALIKFFQSDRVPLSDVYDAFVRLKRDVDDIKGVTEMERNYLRSLIKQRHKFMYGDAHGIAYLLDPRYLGEYMEDYNFKEALEETIFAWNGDNPTIAADEKKQEMALEYTHFVIYAKEMKASNSIRYQILENRSKTIYQYWSVEGARWPNLQKLSLRVFSMAASSAASERAFSTFGFVHSKLRNRLGGDKVEKLVYIKSNYTCFSVLDGNIEEDYSADDLESD